MKKLLALILLIIPLYTTIPNTTMVLADNSITVPQVESPTPTPENPTEQKVFMVSFDGVQQEVAYGESAIPPEPETRKGYVFSAWDTDYSSVTSDLEITSVWDAELYKITFVTNGGNKLSAKSIKFDTKNIALPTPKKPANTFMGWYVDKSLKTKFVSVNKNQTLYAKWVKNPTITFKDKTTTLKTQTVSYKKDISKSEYLPKKTGYKFSGWYQTSTFTEKFDFTKGTTKNITLYAKWSKSTYTPEQLADKYINSCVLVYALDENKEAFATGSGFMVNYNGKIMIVTNYHVIKDSYALKFEMENGKTYSVDKVYAYDSKNDLAILTFKSKISGAKGIPLGSSEKVKIGSNCVAIGSPKGFKNTVSTGLISQKRVIEGTKTLQINAPIDYGSSGGVLLDMQGNAIGITSSGFDSNADINCAIYIEYLKNLLKKPTNTSIQDASGYEDVYYVIKGTNIPYPKEGDYDLYLEGAYIYYRFDTARYQKYITTSCGYKFYKKTYLDDGTPVSAYINEEYGYMVVIAPTDNFVMLMGSYV